MNTEAATTSDMPVNSPPTTAGGRPVGRLAALAAFASRTHLPYQAAVLRIGFASVFTVFLLREWPHRRVLYGDRSPWTLDMATRLLTEDHGFTLLTWWSGRWWFELVYNGTIAAALLLMLGWRTRGMSVLFMVGVLSLENRNIFLGDGGDNVIRIMAIYLVFTRCGQVWSMDARRAQLHGQRAKRDPVGIFLWALLGLLPWWAASFQETGWAVVFWALWGVQGLWYAANRWLPRHEARAVLDSSAAMVHNCAMLVIAVQVCLIYATAGWYKIQGNRWQDGSALYYAAHLDYFAPWPWLTGLLTANMLVVFLLTYGTVMVQVAFPFTLSSRKVKNVLLAMMMLEHAGIAVALGIPFLSLAMMTCDAVFLPTAFLAAVGNRRMNHSGKVLKRSRRTHGRAARPAL